MINSWPINGNYMFKEKKIFLFNTNVHELPIINKFMINSWPINGNYMFKEKKMYFCLTRISTNCPLIFH